MNEGDLIHNLKAARFQIDGDLYEAFNVGIDQAIKIITQHSYWISVNDRLPETTGLSQQYLALMENGDYCACWWMNVGGWDWEPPSPITHWMPLPEPPK